MCICRTPTYRMELHTGSRFTMSLPGLFLRHILFYTALRFPCVYQICCTSSIWVLGNMPVEARWKSCCLKDTFSHPVLWKSAWKRQQNHFVSLQPKKVFILGSKNFPSHVSGGTPKSTLSWQAQGMTLLLWWTGWMEFWVSTQRPTQRLQHWYGLVIVRWNCCTVQIDSLLKRKSNLYVFWETSLRQHMSSWRIQPLPSVNCCGGVSRNCICLYTFAPVSGIPTRYTVLHGWTKISWRKQGIRWVWLQTEQPNIVSFNAGFWEFHFFCNRFPSRDGQPHAKRCGRKCKLSTPAFWSEALLQPQAPQTPSNGWGFGFLSWGGWISGHKVGYPWNQ